MNFKIIPSHVAILVPSVRKAVSFLKRFDFHIGNEQVFESEGTKEVYIEKDRGNSLLLMEPVGPGPYQRALEKRGPGLHHLTIDVVGLEEYIDSLTGSGWLLHPRSLRTIKEIRVAYLARPGFPGIIEVQERLEFNERPLFVDRVLLKMEASLAGLLRFVGLDSVVKASNDQTVISMRGHVIPLVSLF